MCEPTTLAIAGIAASVIGTGVAMEGQMQASAAASNAAKYNAEVAAQNQTIANTEAAQATAAGQVEAQQKANATNEMVGRQKAELAANGVDVNTGSAVDLESDTKAAGQLDQLTIQNNAARTAAGFTNQGISYADQAQLDQANSENTLAVGELGAASTALKGGGSVAGQWYNYTYGNRQANPGYGVSGGI